MTYDIVIMHITNWRSLRWASRAPLRREVKEACGRSRVQGTSQVCLYPPVLINAADSASVRAGLQRSKGGLNIGLAWTVGTGQVSPA